MSDDNHGIKIQCPDCCVGILVPIGKDNGDDYFCCVMDLEYFGDDDNCGGMFTEDEVRRRCGI